VLHSTAPQGLIALNQTNLPFIVQLIPRDEAKHLNRDEGGWEYAPVKGTPYVMRRKPLLSPWHLPGNPSPWGTRAAVEASTSRTRWQVPLSTVPSWPHFAGTPFAFWQHLRLQHRCLARS